MLIVDDILVAPFKGLFWIFNEIRNAALEEQVGEADRITAQLSELYMMLETGRMTEAEFDAAEKGLLDRLDAIKETAADGENEEKEEDVVILKKPPKRQRRRNRHNADVEISDGFAAKKGHSRAGGNPGFQPESRSSL
jgi:hypothetical protein